MNTHKVIRPFKGDRPYKAGEEVDASGWRNADRLVDQRYLRALPVVVSGAALPSQQQKPQQQQPNRR
jgi:hypothetical protein